MKELLRYCLLGLVFAFALVSSAQSTLSLGYVPESFSPSARKVLLSQTATTAQGAIVLPEARMKALTGAKITKIRFAATTGLSSTYVWLKTELSKPAVVSPIRVATVNDGWNEVTLAEPYEITGTQLVVGYNASFAAGACMYFDGESVEQSYVKIGTSDWQSTQSFKYGSVCISAEVALLNGEVVDISLDKVSTGGDYLQANTQVPMQFTVANYTTESITAPTIHCQFGDAPVQTFTYGDTSIASSHSVVLDANVSTAGCVEGHNDFKVWMDVDDDFADNNSVTLDQLCYLHSIPRKILVEEFTTLKCPNCPYGKLTLLNLFEGRTDYVFVAHHVGYGTDELTQNSSNRVMTLLGVNGAPSAAFARTLLSNNVTPAFSIGYTSAIAGANVIRPHYEKLVDEGAFVSVGITNVYDEATRTLTTTVKGDRTPFFNYQCADACLTVEVVEDKVETMASQQGSGETVHSAVYRKALTDVLGDAITWTGDTYEQTFTYTVPESYNVDNLRIVAFVHRPSTGGYNNIQVFNANEQFFLTQGQTAGVHDASSAHVLSRRYFNLQGQPLTAPQQGVYLEQIVTNQGVQTLKRMR